MLSVLLTIVPLELIARIKVRAALLTVEVVDVRHASLLVIVAGAGASD